MLLELIVTNTNKYIKCIVNRGKEPRISTVLDQKNVTTGER